MTDAPYQVLARKYRPQSFDDLIGQEAMVHVLRAAFGTGRIHHAYLLTGVRGVGKTTTARIIAKGLNCIGADGDGGPTVQPCGACEPCRAITESRHVDVIEMDAASNTGVDYIREINEAVRYRAASARYKVYIIDEVHMLSTGAFNALLKTLEEPPGHVKFIFATTEIRKVPVTVLSRCQRFDLRRIEPQAMGAYLETVCAAEGASVEPEALSLLVRASEGSMRDALSLLDQAIASAGGAGPVDAAMVRAMLGVADRARVLDLLELIMRGAAGEALGELRDQHDGGADAAAVLRDLAETVHGLSTVKLAPERALDPSLSPEARARMAQMAEALGMRALTRAWQMLLKSIEEVSLAPSPIMVAEMAIIRLCCVADLPTPEELIRRLESDGASQSTAPAPQRGGGGGGARALAVVPAVEARAAPRTSATPAPQSFEDAVALLKQSDALFGMTVEDHVRPVRFEPGLIEFAPGAGAPGELAGELQKRLSRLTDRRWSVAVVEGGGETLRERRLAEAEALRARVADDPMVAAALEIFPGATITRVEASPRQGQPARNTDNGDE